MKLSRKPLFFHLQHDRIGFHVVSPGKVMRVDPIPQGFILLEGSPVKVINFLSFYLPKNRLPKSLKHLTQ